MYKILYRVLLQRQRRHTRKKHLNLQRSVIAVCSENQWWWELLVYVLYYINHATGLSQCCTHTYYYYYYTYILVGEEIFFFFFGRPTGICVAFMIYGGCFYHTVSGFVIKADGVKWWRWRRRRWRRRQLCIQGKGAGMHHRRVYGPRDRNQIGVNHWRKFTHART